jgi:hypothetical protein
MMLLSALRGRRIGRTVFLGTSRAMGWCRRVVWIGRGLGVGE